MGGGGGGGKSKKVTVGYWYYLGAHLVLCRGLDAITKILVDKREAWTGSVTSNAQISIDKPELFGGEKREGGIQGEVDVLFGGAAQGANDYLSAQLGAPQPAWRGVVSLVLRQVKIAANNPYLKPWAIEGYRLPAKGWYDAKASIGGHANPAHILYEVLTSDPDTHGIGLGLTSGLVDDTAFRAAADTLYSEGFGLSFEWSEQGGADRLIQMVLDHIAATLYVSPSTGQFVLKLIRADYDPGALTVLDEGNVLALESYQRRTLSETVNEVTVTYTDQATYDQVTISVQDLANLQAQGYVVAQQVAYPGICDHSLAARVARRDLVAGSALVARVRLRANRDARGLRPGSVFKLDWPPLGLSGLVLRVGELSEGAVDDGSVVIEAVEDVFALPSNTYLAAQPVGWVDPVSTPANCPRRRLVEAPYWELVRTISAADLAYVGDSAGYVQTLGERPSGDAYAYELWTKGSEYARVGTAGFTPVGIVSGAIEQELTTVVTLSASTDLELVAVDSYAYLNGEVVKVKAISGAQVTLARGVLDTVPVSHSDGSVLWFADYDSGADPTEYAASETVYAKLLPITGLGTLDISLASAQSVTLDSRQIRPYPPGKVLLNGVAYPDAVLGELTVSWAHRDRELQTAYLVEQTEASIGPETGTTYTLRIYGEAGGLLRTETGLTGTSYTWTTEATDSALPDGRLNENLHIELESVRDGYTSWQHHDIAFRRAGYGFNYGEDYGGI